MQEYNWLLSAISDLRAYSEDKNMPDLVAGLQHVLATYAEEAALLPEEAQKLLAKPIASNGNDTKFISSYSTK